MAVLVETEQTFFPDEFFERGTVRRKHVDRDVVMTAHLFDEPVGLGVQPAGIEGEYPDARIDLHRHIDQDHVLGAAEGNGNVIE